MVLRKVMAKAVVSETTMVMATLRQEALPVCGPGPVRPAGAELTGDVVEPSGPCEAGLPGG